jgi:galactokinase
VHDLRAMKNCCLRKENTNKTTRNKRTKSSTIALKDIEKMANYFSCNTYFSRMSQHSFGETFCHLKLQVK